MGGTRTSYHPFVIIPLGTDRPSLRPMLVTPLLMGLNIAVFVALAALGSKNPDQLEAIRRALMLQPHDFHWYQPITSAFLHADFWHIAANMLFLWVFGPNIEDRLGKWWFLVFYVGGAFAASGLHVAFEDAPALGASGAVSALTGAYLVLFPRTQIKALFLLFLRPFSVSAWWFIVGAFVWDLIGQGARADNIAHLAHIGGSIYGASVMLILLWTKLLPREIYDLFSIARQAHRRRQLKEATADGHKRAATWWGNDKKEGVVSGEAVAAARAEVQRLLTALDMPGAGRAYKALMTDHAAVPGATVLSVKYMEQLAAHYYAARLDGPESQREDHRKLAAYVMEKMIAAYPREQGTPRCRVLLALLLSHEMNDPARAKSLLEEAIPYLHDDAELAIAKEELAAITAKPQPVQP